jgi:hypothetical protein
MLASDSSNHHLHQGREPSPPTVNFNAGSGQQQAHQSGSPSSSPRGGSPQTHLVDHVAAMNWKEVWKELAPFYQDFVVACDADEQVRTVCTNTSSRRYEHLTRQDELPPSLVSSNHLQSLDN